MEAACKLFELSRSSYYEWCANEDSRTKASIEYAKLSIQIELLFYHYKSRYGARRIKDELLKLGIKCSCDKVSKILRNKDLIPVGYIKYKVTTTNSNHKYKVFDNLLERNFTVDKPNQVYVGCFVFCATKKGIFISLNNVTVSTCFLA
ncbi:MAG: putative transposase [Pseudomonadota bacterium]|nr:putative transposase [Pseudomonadota bacterium]